MRSASDPNAEIGLMAKHTRIGNVMRRERKKEHQARRRTYVLFFGGALAAAAMTCSVSAPADNRVPRHAQDQDRGLPEVRARADRATHASRRLQWAVRAVSCGCAAVPAQSESNPAENGRRQ